MKFVVERLVEDKAVIFPDAFSGSYAAYPWGDRRKRPTCWLKAETFKKLRAEGVIEMSGKGYRISRSYAARTRHKQGDNPHAAQHGTLENRDMYVPSGVVRNTRRNHQSTVLQKLSRVTANQPQPFLTAAETEAGERFADDYAKCAYASVSTQNYNRAGVSGTTTNAAMADVSACRIDARQRVTEALAYVGSGLDKAVMSICVNELRIEQIERTENWAKGSGRTVLKLALQRLSVFYGTVPGVRAMRA